MMEIDERIKKIMAMIFETDLDFINENASMDTIEGWDSLKHINLIISLEQEFNISFPDQEVASLITFPLIKMAVTEAIDDELSS